MLDKHLIASSGTGESKVFYYKMKGDYHRSDYDSLLLGYRTIAAIIRPMEKVICRSGLKFT